MRRLLFLPLAFLALTGCSRQPAANQSRAERAYNTAGARGKLREFLAAFPKAADLHVHLSGAVYAESFIRAAGEDKLCIDPVGLKFASQQNPKTKSWVMIKEPCPKALVPASQLSGNISGSNQVLYDRLINAFSMRSFVPTTGFSGHDQFFATFGHFSGLDKRHTGEWVDEVAQRAAAQNQQYLELMETPPFGNAAGLAAKIGWKPEPTADDLAALRQKLLDAGLRDEVATDRDDVRSAEALRKQREQCGTPQAAPACQVTTRYIYQILRGYAPEQVFAQTLLGFETITESEKQHDGGFVGINFVMPEDGFISMRDYTLQMRMLDYLHSVYPAVHISLHAGELAPGLVPPEGLRFHIRQAVELGHAERIGHGVDILHEENANALLRELADKHIMVEVNLSSNEGILGVEGEDHPFRQYRLAHVPVALSTDDEGVSRIDITNEYERAAETYHLKYKDLKDLSRTGLEHSFLSGASLWAQPDDFSAPAADCKGELPGGPQPAAACKTFLDANEKANAQWELERRFLEFESRY